MTECDNADLRDLLPDFVAETLDATASALVLAHLATCEACEAEVGLLRLARAVRPQAVHLDVAAIVARLAVPVVTLEGAPESKPALRLEPSGARAHGLAVETVSARRRRPLQRAWQFAAAIGVVVLGGSSVMIARSGGVRQLAVARSDSVPLGDATLRPAPVVSTSIDSTKTRAVATGPSREPVAAPTAVGANTSMSRTALVSVGDLSDYTDAELQRMLDRLERWDGATSGDVMPSLPIVPVGDSRGNP